jgi:hypothetical protein
MSSEIKIKEFNEIKSDFIEAIKSNVIENSSGYYNVTDYNVGGVLNTIVEAFSAVLEQFYFNLFQVTKESLENIYNGFNFYKMPGKKATTTVSIYFNSTDLAAVRNSVIIPRGTIITSEDGLIEFEIVDDFQSSNIYIAPIGNEFVGKVCYSAMANSINVGFDKNISNNKLTKFATSITNINNYEYNIRNSAATGGADEETEEEMKLRFHKYLVSLRRGTLEALQYVLQTNENFTGFKYSINKYEPIFILKQKRQNVNQTDFTSNTNNYDVDYTDINKFDMYYDLCTSDDAPENEYFALYFGSYNKFKNLLFITQSVTSNMFKIKALQYYDSVLGLWNDIDPNLTNIVTPDHYFTNGQYIYWDFADITRWGKTNIQNYNAYFIRLIIQQLDNPSTEPSASIVLFKAMTYPFPGYIDVFCLKNYSEKVTESDKKVIHESLENYKAAGVVTTIENADVIKINPTIVLYTSQELINYIPDSIVDDIKSVAFEYSNNLNINDNFDRNKFYSYIHDRFSQFGSIFIYYKYDNVIRENSKISIYKEQLRDILIESTIREKISFEFVDVFITTNLNNLITVDSSTFYSDYEVLDVDAFHAVAY